MPFRHHIRVRSGDIDAQRVVFNPHYLAYVDDTVDTWFRTAVGVDVRELGWSTMLKAAAVEWHASARLGHVLDLEAAVERWGTTSFEVGVRGRVEHRPIFTAVLTYVSVEPDTLTPMTTPDSVRRALGDDRVQSGA